ncbi:hypothetical protein LQ938_05935 [Microbacterium sp. cx-55]|uniref:hypothetical protein n=1 Tax=unclassified Microbacterium TaxID=2609290 RepID=UPI001CBC9831|nr:MULTISPECIES: hypothetical protein [unclassified Microbacterium]MBZ4486718.1 hypothetical protein [Microbacterium sp. cx-55]MCC4907685.1 hypothetical protein [Microbacterium sp. cx-59]UGB36322.1 hypothetical protein LQ938_05935 [Microbacterium sp. cx-55]
MSAHRSWDDSDAEQLLRTDNDERDAQDFSDYFALWMRQSAYINVNRRIKDHLVRDWQVPRLPGSSQKRPRRYADGIPWSMSARDLLFSLELGKPLSGSIVFEHVRPLQNTVAQLTAAYVQGDGRDGPSMLEILRRVHTGWCFAVVTKSEDTTIKRRAEDDISGSQKYAELQGGSAGFELLRDDPRFAMRFS